MTEKKHQSTAEKQKAYRERKKEEARKLGAEVVDEHADALRKLGKMPKELEDLGRAYGTDEADRRGETGKKKEERIARAIRYQEFLWERDGASSG